MALSNRKNLGPKLISELNKVGVYSFDDLKKEGSVTIYRKLKKLYPEKTLPKCYYLYSFEGAILDKDWRDLTSQEKEKLVQQIS